jgi:hypothetical protein
VPVIRDRWIGFYGLASWAIPLAVSVLFFGPGGQLMVPLPLFKSAMVVVGGGVGAALLVAAFRRVPPSTTNGFVLGLYWLVINIVLDLLILVPITKIPVQEYLFDIGLRYLLMPIMSTAMGHVAARPSVMSV